MAQDASVFEVDEAFLFSAKLEAELTPLIHHRQNDNIDDELNCRGVSTWGLTALFAQWFSSSWGFRMSEFAVHLYLISYFEDTLLPNAIYGFTSCVTNIILAQWLGSLVDRVPKLLLVRTCMVVQRLSMVTAYSALASLFYFKHTCEMRGIAHEQSITMPAFRVILLAGALLQASNTGLNISIQQDWVPCLATGSSERLSSLNAQLKRVDLTCKLVAPMFVSVLSTHIPHVWAAGIMASLMLFGLVADVLCIGIVYQLCPALASHQTRKEIFRRISTNYPNLPDADSTLKLPIFSSSWLKWAGATKYWAEFIHLPTFFSSLAAALLAMSVLTFDGSMLSFLTSQGYSDNVLSLMRGANGLASFVGTVLSPLLETRLGLVRGGTISIWPSVVSLVPAVVALHFVWNAFQQTAIVMLFTGIALSSIGFASFELVQMKQLQLMIEDHPRKNTLASLQFTLFHSSDLMKYILTMFFFSRPNQFKWTALLSFISIIAGGASYAKYARVAMLQPSTYDSEHPYLHADFESQANRSTPRREGYGL